MMFYRNLFLLLLVLAAMLQGQTNKVDLVRREKIEEAAVLAVEQSISSLQKQQRSADQLAAVILGDPSAHARRDTSEKILFGVERNFLEIAVRGQLASFASTRSDLPAGWVEQVMTRQRERIGKTVEDLLNTGFRERFKRARELAIEAQRGKLSLRLTPTARDLEDMASPYRSFADLPLDAAQRRAVESGSAVIGKYVAEAHAGQVIFEENESYLRERAAEILSREITEMWQQLRYIVQHTGGGEVEASRIELVIAKGMSSLPSGRSPFPLTRTAIRDRAVELEQDLFLGYVKSQLTGPCPALSPDIVLKGVPVGSDSLPATMEEHVALVVPSVRARTSAALIENWTVRVPNLDRAALQRRLEQDMKNMIGSQLLAAGLEHCVRDAIRPFRETVAARELSAKSPGVANLSQALDDDAIDQLNRASNTEAALQLPLLADPKLHMEESRKIFSENRRILLEEGSTGVRTQLSLVKDPERVTRYQNQLPASRGRGGQQQLQTAYEREVFLHWNERRPGLLARMNGRISDPNKYENLFRVTREEIRNVLKDDSVPSSVKSASNGQSGPGGGGTGTGGGKGSGIGPGSGADEGGGGGAANSNACVSKGDRDWRTWLYVGLLVTAVAALVHWWGYKRGARTKTA